MKARGEHDARMGDEDANQDTNSAPKAVEMGLVGDEREDGLG